MYVLIVESWSWGSVGVVSKACTRFCVLIFGYIWLFEGILVHDPVGKTVRVRDIF